MRLIRLLAFCAWAAPFLAHADQTGQIMTGSADFSYDLVAHITTVLKSAPTTSEIAELGGEIQARGTECTDISLTEPIAHTSGTIWSMSIRRRQIPEVCILSASASLASNL